MGRWHLSKTIRTLPRMSMSWQICMKCSPRQKESVFCGVDELTCSHVNVYCAIKQRNCRSQITDLPVQIGRGQDWGPRSDCVSPPRLCPPSPLSLAAFDWSPLQPHQAGAENALRAHSSSPPCWGSGDQLATPHRSCEEKGSILVDLVHFLILKTSIPFSADVLFSYLTS